MGKVGAPYGNKNAEKWTFKKAIRLYNDAIELSNQKETFKINGKNVEGYSFDFIGEIARELGTYHKLITIHLPERFPQLNRKKNELLSNLESNCYSNGKKGIIKEASALMNLKSNWAWTDRQQLDHTSKGDKINIPPITWVDNGDKQ